LRATISLSAAYLDVARAAFFETTFKIDRGFFKLWKGEPTVGRVNTLHGFQGTIGIDLLRDCLY
jgi:hypothetical protein